MLQVAEEKAEQKPKDWMIAMCNDMFREWLFDLTPEEQEIWLWNAMVGILRIKQRRKS